MAQRKATKPPLKKSELQLTGEMLAVRGTGDDNDDPANKVMEDDAIWNWLLDKAKPQERANLHMKTAKERATLIEMVREDYRNDKAQVEE